MIRVWVFGLTFYFFSAFAFATPLFQAPTLSAPVIDEVGFLGSKGQARVASALRDLRTQADVQMAIYVPQSLNGMDIESFSITVAEQWKLGKKGLGPDGSRGLLLVIAPHEKRMRFEVGYGLEGQIPDALARRILERILKPYLRSNQPTEGLLRVTAAVAEAVGVSWRPEGVSRQRGSSLGGGQTQPLWWLGSKLLGLVVFVLLYLSSMGDRSVSRGRFRNSASGLGGWSGGGGSFGGGGWSGGGGSFGGGGASSSW